MPKINLLYVITKLELGGAQLSTLDLIKSLDGDTYNIHLITGPEGILLEDALSIPNLSVHVLSSLRRDINVIRDICTIISIYRFVKSKQIDIVHTHSSKAGILGRCAARLAGVKFIAHTIHGWEFHSFQNKFKRVFYVFLERIAATFTDQMIAVTEHDIDKGLQNKIGRQDQYKLVRCGIRRDKFGIGGNGVLRARLGLDKSDFLVGMVACFKQQKSPQDFILAAKKVANHVPRAKFIMVGDGQLKSRLLELIQRLSLEDKFFLMGWQRDIAQVMHSLDVLVLTSLWEGLPMVFLEAMASGKPIVANDICGNHEVVKDGINGFLVRPKDLVSLANRIVQLYQDRSLAQSMGEKGREALSSHFELKYMVSSIHDIYSFGLKRGGEL